MNFDQDFQLLTGRQPFPWQRALYARFIANDWPASCDLPTGTGKTMVMAVWLLALVHACRAGTSTAFFPRRLVYVVNRRTVVDQATTEAEKLRKALLGAKAEHLADPLRKLGVLPDPTPLAISTLRGEFRDNGEWRADPARPAIIIGTVDMIGSRLLFSGYGCGFKSRPLHAGFLAQDALLVHDEAHLEEPFQRLVEAIAAEQSRNEWERRRGLRVLALTATSRTADTGFTLTSEDLADATIRARVRASKTLYLTECDPMEVVDKAFELASREKESNKAVLCFLRSPEEVDGLADKLTKLAGAERVAVLTGTMRGLERESLTTSPVFARYTPDPPKDVKPAEGTVFLVCTAAGEVGIDISGDHMVCDLTPFDSMAQRLGRVNRYGARDAEVHVVVASNVIKDKEDDGGDDDEDQDDETAGTPAAQKRRSVSQYLRRQRSTYALLQRLPARGEGFDASPLALRELPEAARAEAFSPSPVVPAVTELLFDRWALTSIRDTLPGRPPVADWLHGIAWEPPTVTLAWRREVTLLEARAESHPRGDPLIDDVLEDYPLKSFELLTERADRFLRRIQKASLERKELPLWVLKWGARSGWQRVSELAEKEDEDLRDATIVIDPRFGGLSSKGLFDGTSEGGDALDVADEWRDESKKQRRARTDGTDEPPDEEMRLVRTFERPAMVDGETDEDGAPVPFCWFVVPRAADDDGSRTSIAKQLLDDHLRSTGGWAASLASRLGVAEPERRAVVSGAHGHDRGKHRAAWQWSIRNRAYPDEVLAKGRVRPLDLDSYRHELGSLFDLARDEDWRAQPASELAQHVVAAHHGRARPSFPSEEWVDPQVETERVLAETAEAPKRFERLQQRYGRWGLAWLESLLRAADFIASAHPEWKP